MITSVPLLIAVTGHRDPHPAIVDELSREVRAQLRKLLDDYPHTPLRLGCGMAQGADLLVAKEALALAEEFPGRISVLPLLAFPPAHFLTTFHSVDPAEPPGTMDIAAQQLFNDLLPRCEPWLPAPTFDERAALPARTDDAAWTALLADDALRRRRYEEVGATMALYGQMTFALLDESTSGKPGGTAEVAGWCMSFVPESIYPAGLHRLGNSPQSALLRIHTPRRDAATPGRVEVKWRWPGIAGECSPEAAEAAVRRRFGGWEEDDPLRRAHQSHLAMLESFERLNRALPDEHDDAAVAAAAKSHFGDAAASVTSARLRKLAMMRSAISKVTNARWTRLRWCVRVIFILIPASALCGHLYVGFVHSHGDYLVYDPRWLAGFVVLVLLAWGFGGLLHALHYEPHTLDLRSLAEALRVQIYWSLAGLPDSVPASYSQRQRGEFQWIRSAVRGIALPYSEASGEFQTLTPAGQLARLQAVRDRWIDGQRAWFLKSFRDYRQRILRTKWLGHGLALAGWALAAGILVLSLLTRCEPAHAPLTLLAALILAGGIFIAYGENRRYPELAFNYERMFQLYAQVCRRFDLLLAEARAASDADRPQLIAQMQTIIRSLGREALDENADWLTLHRARPFETPVH